MQKVVFKNKVFYGLLVAYFIALLSYNLYATIITSNIYGLLPISIQSALLFLIFTKNKQAKLFITIWAAIFLIFAYGLIVLGNVMQGIDNLKVNSFIIDLIQIGGGIVIVSYTQSTVIVSSSNSNLGNDLEGKDSSNFDEGAREKI